MKNNKICIIGIDGATFDLIGPWAEKGYLPNIKKIMSNGSYGPLRSSIPDNSAPAWTSIVTGVNPGKHRVFSFTHPGNDIAKIRITNSSTKTASSIWNIFSKHHLKVCIINVPLTYPPEQVNGIMISGMDTPTTDTVYTYPETLKYELDKKFGRYKIEPECATTWTFLNEKGKLAYIDEVHQIEKLRLQVAIHFLKEYLWDFFMIVFVSTDRIQHKFWADMDKDHPFFNKDSNKNIQNAILNTYKLIDSFVGDISKILSHETQLVIVSDHGFGPRSPNVISINRFLSRNNLLTFKTRKKSGFNINLGAGMRLFSDFSRQRLSPMMQKRIKRLLPFLRGKGFSSLHFSNIDWSKTKAFTDEAMGLIWINRKDRFDMGIVNPGDEYEQLCQEIVTLLRGLKDKETGIPILRYAYRKEDVYSGKFLPESPDILFAYSDQFSFPEGGDIANIFKDEDFIGRAEDTRKFLQITGLHRPNGIIILKGRDIKKDIYLQNINVTDVMPTCLYLAGLPIPKDIDGHIIKQIIEDDFKNKNSIQYDDAINDITKNKNDEDLYSQKEKKQIEDRLKDLGYL